MLNNSNENRHIRLEQQNEAPKSKKPKKPKNKITKIIGITVIAVLVIAVGFAAKYVIDMMNIKGQFTEKADNAEQMEIVNIGYVEPDEEPEEESEDRFFEIEETPEPTLSPEELLERESDPEFLKERVNILLLGLDRSEERKNWGAFRTDTMILISVNIDDQKATMISIPRDSFVKIHNKKSRGKINSAFSVGGGLDKNGFEYSMETVSKLFGGAKIDYYVGFDMNLVKQVVDVIGGIDYDVDIKISMNGRKLDIGSQRLDGQGVLDYSRMRKGSSDVARVERQQNILMAVFRELKQTKQITKIPEIYGAVQENIDTNLSLQQIGSLALFANKIGIENVEKRIVEGDFLNMYATSYWGVSNVKLKSLVKEVFGFSFNPDPSNDVYSLKSHYSKQIAEQAAIAALQPSEAESDDGLLDDGIAVESTGSAGESTETSIPTEETGAQNEPFIEDESDGLVNIPEEEVIVLE